MKCGLVAYKLTVTLERNLVALKKISTCRPQVLVSPALVSPSEKLFPGGRCAKDIRCSMVSEAGSWM